MPRTLWRAGANYVSVDPDTTQIPVLDSPRYFLRVDSFSLLIDGGEGSDFAASLGVPTGAGSSTKIPLRRRAATPATRSGYFIPR